MVGSAFLIGWETKLFWPWVTAKHTVLWEVVMLTDHMQNASVQHFKGCTLKIKIQECLQI